MSKFLNKTTYLHANADNLTALGTQQIRAAAVGDLLDANGKIKVESLPNLAISTITVANTLLDMIDLAPELQSGDSVRVLEDDSYHVYDGSTFIQVVFRQSLDSLSDCVITTPSNGQFLKFTTQWVNSALSVSDISNVNLTSPQNNQMLVYSGGNIINQTRALNTSSDVMIATPQQEGEYLTWRNDRWENALLTLTSITNITINTPVNGQYLGYSDGQWINLIPYTSVLNQTGDILYYNVGSHARLPIGVNGQVLGIESGLPAWLDTPKMLSELGDVILNNQTMGDGLIFDGVQWINAAIGAGITDHQQLTSIGVNDHAGIDYHISDPTIHPNLDILLENKGDLLTRHYLDGVKTYSIGASPNGNVLACHSSAPYGIEWKRLDHTVHLNNVGTKTHAEIDSFMNILTTRGDILMRGSSAVNRLPLGTVGKVLTVDNSFDGGFGWVTPAAGGGLTIGETFTGTNKKFDIALNSNLSHVVEFDYMNIMTLSGGLYKSLDNVNTTLLSPFFTHSREIIMVKGYYYLFTGDHKIYKSPDMKAWITITTNLASLIEKNTYHTNSPTLPSYASCVVHDGSKFIIGGYQGAGSAILAYSTDTITWTACTITGVTLASNVNVTCVSYNGVNKYVAVCKYPDHILTSSDGITWARNSYSGTISGDVWAAIANNGGNNWVISAENTAISSDNGVTWTTTKSSDQGCNSVIYHNSKFIIADFHGQIHTSSDNGATWSTNTLGLGTFGRIQYINNQYIVTRDAVSTEYLTSPDNIVYTIKTAPSNVVNFNKIYVDVANYYLCNP